MKTSPHIDWLMRRWNLPESAVPEVTRLLEEEARGSTAVELRAPVADWGNAVTDEKMAGAAPLIRMEFQGREFLQSTRLYQAERDIARRIQNLSSLPEQPAPDPLALAALFPGAGSDDAQRRAAQLALTRSLALITGGPGTGKTYTLARILALLAGSGISPERIRLAAPTGKAADRMKKAVAESIQNLPEHFRDRLPALSAIAESSSTLHSLLGYHPGRERCSFDARNPLPASALIVDECSMVDARLWQALFAAVPAGCRLILLGDPHQLESVGQGNVFAELARRAAGTSGLADCHVHLTEARRFRDRPAILELARSLEACDPEAAVQVLVSGRESAADAGVSWREVPSGFLPCPDFPAPILAGLERVAAAESPERALEALGKVCVLTAQREYFVGSRAVSQAIEAHFSGRPGVRNQPVIINRNDPETGLRNGTVGVLHAAADGTRRAYFPGISDALREFPLARLPDFSPAWAITIHRSQGSEYDAVLVILPHEQSPMTTRELLYTAITRARREVYVAGSLESVRRAALTPSSRITLLGAHFSARE